MVMITLYFVRRDQHLLGAGVDASPKYATEYDSENIESIELL